MQASRDFRFHVNKEHFGSQIDLLFSLFTSHWHTNKVSTEKHHASPSYQLMNPCFMNRQACELIVGQFQNRKRRILADRYGWMEDPGDRSSTEHCTGACGPT
jgi:hypothetical protein